MGWCWQPLSGPVQYWPPLVVQVGPGLPVSFALPTIQVSQGIRSALSGGRTGQSARPSVNPAMAQ